MTIWHKPTEKPRKGTLYVLLETSTKHFYLLYSDGYPYGIDNEIKKWCYLSDLLKLERENKRLKKQIEDGYMIRLDGRILKVKEVIK